ncbi:hypothetical protein ARMSODRAFT_383136 [Armillaria solidipes]|uniref:Transmembrane protein n=1 Tax=Armillaria solidipes TaxID=1076256 RepID=A0A2H3B502_9AGAR|nr:hypothetical protein ARMSODRAFT_383136 [Armillaria solidipes]
MLLSFTAFILQTVFVVWLSASASKLLPTTNISWGWLDAVLADVGLLDPNTTWTELGDTFFQGVVILSESSVLQPVAVLTANSPLNEPEDVDVPVDDTPPQGIIRQLLEPVVAVVEVTLAATTPVDDAVTLVSVHPQPTQFPASVTRVGSRLWSSPPAGSIAPVSLFTILIAVLVGFAMGFFARSVSPSAGWDNLPTLFVEVCGPSETVTSCAIDSVVSSTMEAHRGGHIRQGEVVVEDIQVPEQAEHGENFELQAMDNTASIPSGIVARIDALEPLKTSVGIQFTSEVREVKDASVSCEPVSRASVGIQCSIASDEQTDKFVPGESRGSLYATAAEGSSPSQMMDDPDVFSVPTVSSDFNIYTMAETMSFPSVDDLRKPTEFERLRQDIRGFGCESEADGRMAPSLPATELGVSPSTSIPASPRLVRAKPLEYFRERWGADTKHLWAREFWHRALRSEELIQTVYHAMFPLDEAATDEDKYEMEVGKGLVRISAWRLSEHTTNPILRLPYNAPSEDADHKESFFVSAEANPTIQTAVSSSASIGTRSPSPFVRPSNPQSRFFESSSEASEAAPTIPSPSRTPAACRRRPALAQITNAPRTGRPSPSRTPMKVGRVQGARNAVPTPPPSLRPKLAKGKACFPPVVPKMRFEDESMSPTRPARRCPPSSKFPRWRG